jgi:hypothetical protein
VEEITRSLSKYKESKITSSLEYRRILTPGETSQEKLYTCYKCIGIYRNEMPTVSMHAFSLLVETQYMYLYVETLLPYYFFDICTVKNLLGRFATQKSKRMALPTCLLPFHKSPKVGFT